MKKAISATLAGALAVGMVPAMAFAAEGDQELELQATVVEAVQAGSIVLAKGQTDGMTFTAGSEKPYLVPTGVLPAGESVTPLGVGDVYLMKLPAVGEAGSNSSFYDGGKTLKITGSAKCSYDPATGELSIVTPNGIDSLDLVAGNYAIGVKAADNASTPENENVIVDQVVKFSVVSQAIQGIEFYEVNTATNSLADTEFAFDGEAFVFDGADGNVGLKMGGKDLTETDFTIKFFDPATNQELGAPLAAGTYNAVITGKDTSAYKGQSATIQFVVKPYDLAVAALSIDDQKLATAATTLADLTTELQKNISGLNATQKAKVQVTAIDKAVTGVGEYTATVALVAAADDAVAKASIVNSQKVKFNVVSALDHDVTAVYKTTAADYDFSSVNKDLPKIDFSKGGVAFDPANLKVQVRDLTTGLMRDAAASEYTVKYTKTDGAVPVAVDASALGTTGTYTVEVVLNPAAFNYAVAGDTELLNVDVTAGDVSSAGMTVSYKGVAQYKSGSTTSVSHAFDGTDALDSLNVTIKAGTKTLVADSDYTVKITKTADAAGAITPVVVTDVVDAGSYTMVLESKSYNLSAVGNIVITVAAETVTAAKNPKVEGQFQWDNDDNDSTPAVPAYYYTGKEIAPVILFDDKVSGLDPVWKTLPADSYKLTITEFIPEGKQTSVKATAVKEPGKYTIKIADAAAKDNYTVNEITGLVFYVTDKTFFSDVASDAWYADVVSRAAAEDYMNGYAGTTMFGPMDTLTRGQLMCVLYNMAGGVASLDDAILGDDAPQYESFADVEANKFYSRAIYWAKEAGIANGYGDGTFGPNDPVTREQTACFLANFAKAYKEYEAPAAVDAALAGYADGKKTSGWAKDSVAWAVENGIMGNGKALNPKGTIVRAEAAAMAMNYHDAFIA